MRYDKIIKVRRIFISMLTAILLVSSTPVMASNGGNGGNASVNAYYAPATFTFYGSAQSVKAYDGAFMAIEANATSSTGTNETINISVYIENRGITQNYSIQTNGVTKKFDYIFLGFGGGSDVRIRVSCSNTSAEITMNLISYSW